ncbi:MAG TPA: hypothetical protein VNT79_01495, partial [Phycisphaerae bacterium]|nr:hypothetical protein [Phycisphaerae bacterium]
MSFIPRCVCAFIFLFPGLASAGGPRGAAIPLPTSVANYYIRGTQPNQLTDFIQSPDECGSCHGGEPNNRVDWDGSLMSQSARDPLFYAALDIAEHDAPGIGDTCLRCHVPQGWLEGRATPTDGSAIEWGDREGVSCAVCHRSVDPFGGPDSPPPEAQILGDLGDHAPIPSMDLMGSFGHGGNGGFVIDPVTRLRGPFPISALPPNQTTPPAVSCTPFHNSFYSQPTFDSPFFRGSEICASCHDVSTPHFLYNAAEDRFAFDFDNPGRIEPTSNKYHMFPQQRTYSEWLRSAFALGGVNMEGRFGGTQQPMVSECMDCHMPKSQGNMCAFVSTQRDDLGRHFLNGAATWVLDAIGRAFGPEGTFELSFDRVLALQEGIGRNRKMLRCAADLAVDVETHAGGTPQLRVRVTNQTGHKLPTGLPEGRRIWLNVEFFDACATPGVPVAVHGAYDAPTNTLDAASTKVYEAKVGPGPDLAPDVGLPPGPSFHVALSNQVWKDNRIPPRGFSNAAYSAINAAPVDATYADGQFWDETRFPIPPNATGVRVRLFYEAASREYIEFLRDRNPNAAQEGDRGEVLYNLWANGGNTPQPELMAVFPPTEAVDDGMAPCWLAPNDLATLDPDGDGIHAIAPSGDLNGDFVFDDLDLLAFAAALMSETPSPVLLCKLDSEADGVL